MRLRAWIVFLSGCTAPLTVAELRDAAPIESAPTLGEAAVTDANDEPPDLGDPVDDAGAG